MQGHGSVGKKARKSEMSPFIAQFRHLAVVFLTLSDDDETLNTHLPGIPIVNRKLNYTILFKGVNRYEV